MNFKTPKAVIAATLFALTTPIVAQAQNGPSEETQTYETLEQSNIRILNEILMSKPAMSMEQSQRLLATDQSFTLVREQPISFELSGPLRFSVMEELLRQRFENNINDRGQTVTGQSIGKSLDSSAYIRSTVAAAELSFPF